MLRFSIYTFTLHVTVTGARNCTNASVLLYAVLANEKMVVQIRHCGRVVLLTTTTHICFHALVGTTYICLHALVGTTHICLHALVGTTHICLHALVGTTHICLHALVGTTVNPSASLLSQVIQQTLTCVKLL